MKASLDQRIDSQVKCDRSIQLAQLSGSCREEDDDDDKNKGAKRCNRTVPKMPNRVQKAEPILKSRTPVADRTPAKEPNL